MRKIENIFKWLLLKVFNYNRYRIMNEIKCKITGRIYRHILDKKNNVVRVELIEYK